MENRPNTEGKNHGRQPANLYYIGCVFTTPSGGLQEELTERGANPGEDLLRIKPPAAGLRFAPSEVGLFFYNEFGSQYNTAEQAVRCGAEQTGHLGVAVRSAQSRVSGERKRKEDQTKTIRSTIPQRHPGVF